MAEECCECYAFVMPARCWAIFVMEFLLEEMKGGWLDEWLRKGARNVESVRRRGSMGGKGCTVCCEYDVRA